ncbi:hypothetical protein D3C78_1802520 [compost metagenome]
MKAGRKLRLAKTMASSEAMRVWPASASRPLIGAAMAPMAPTRAKIAISLCDRPWLRASSSGTAVQNRLNVANMQP